VPLLVTLKALGSGTSREMTERIIRQPRAMVPSETWREVLNRKYTNTGNIDVYKPNFGGIFASSE